MWAAAAPTVQSWSNLSFHDNLFLIIIASASVFRSQCEDVRYYSVYQKLTVQLWRGDPTSLSGALVSEWAEDVTRNQVILTARSVNSHIPENLGGF